MRVKIVSDGTLKGTKVVDCISGEELGKVEMVNWSVGSLGAEALVHLYMLPVEVEGEVALVSWDGTTESTLLRDFKGE